MEENRKLSEDTKNVEEGYRLEYAQKAKQVIKSLKNDSAVPDIAAELAEKVYELIDYSFQNGVNDVIVLAAVPNEKAEEKPGEECFTMLMLGKAEPRICINFSRNLLQSVPREELMMDTLARMSSLRKGEI